SRASVVITGRVRGGAEVGGGTGGTDSGFGVGAIDGVRAGISAPSLAKTRAMAWPGCLAAVTASGDAGTGRRGAGLGSGCRSSRASVVITGRVRGGAEVGGGTGGTDSGFGVGAIDGVRAGISAPSLAKTRAMAWPGCLAAVTASGDAGTGRGGAGLGSGCRSS